MLRRDIGTYLTVYYDKLKIAASLITIGSVFGDGEHSLDLSFEGEVKSLGGEVSETVSQVTPPERVEALVGEGPGCTVDDSLVWLVQPALFDHLILILDEELYSLDRGSGGLKWRLVILTVKRLRFFRF